MDLECLGKKAGRIAKAKGITDQATFRRINEQQSGQPHSFFKERKSAEKVYDSWVIDCIVDENPQANRYGRVGAEVEAEVIFYIYDNTTEAGETYVPDHHDRVDWRDTTYEVISIIRLQPNNGKQMGFQVEAKRFR